MQTALFNLPWLLPVLSPLRNIQSKEPFHAPTPLVTHFIMFRGMGKSALTVLPGGGKREAAELPLTAGGEVVKAGGDAFIFCSHSGASLLLIGASQATDQCLWKSPPRVLRPPTSRSSAALRRHAFPPAGPRWLHNNRKLSFTQGDQSLLLLWFLDLSLGATSLSCLQHHLRLN